MRETLEQGKVRWSEKALTSLNDLKPGWEHLKMKEDGGLVVPPIMRAMEAAARLKLVKDAKGRQFRPKLKKRRK